MDPVSKLYSARVYLHSSLKLTLTKFSSCFSPAVFSIQFTCQNSSHDLNQFESTVGVQPHSRVPGGEARGVCLPPIGGGGATLGTWIGILLDPSSETAEPWASTSGVLTCLTSFLPLPASSSTYTTSSMSTSLIQTLLNQSSVLSIILLELLLNSTVACKRACS